MPKHILWWKRIFGVPLVLYRTEGQDADLLHDLLLVPATLGLRVGPYFAAVVTSHVGFFLRCGQIVHVGRV